MANKRQQWSLAPCRSAAKRRWKQQHLYLVLDDWERGYSVYKVDVDAFVGSNADAEPEPLPEPPVVRFEARHGNSWFFAAHGTRIFAMQPSGCPAFPVFDTETLGLTVCPWPSRPEVRSKPFFASVAGKLFVLRGGCCFDVLGSPPPPPDTCYDSAWSWTRLPSLPPFDHRRVGSSALHPDGRTLFVSGDTVTFSFDTESLEWACHGDWVMPFKGQAFFDGELDAWVGLCRHEGGVGHICCCSVAPAASDCSTLPEWKLAKDQLYRPDSERHLGVTLLYMGNSSYCLVESLARDDEEDLERLHGDGYYPHHRVLRVATFALKYDKHGVLTATQRKERSYQMTDAHQLPEPSWNPVAFWM